jgi:hypothetical protein
MILSTRSASLADRFTELEEKKKEAEAKADSKGGRRR